MFNQEIYLGHTGRGRGSSGSGEQAVGVGSSLEAALSKALAVVGMSCVVRLHLGVCVRAEGCAALSGFCTVGITGGETSAPVLVCLDIPHLRHISSDEELCT
jgi:hypothetical protein